MKIQAGRAEINYELAGEGECIVLIHGFSDNLTMWYNQVLEFSKNYKVLTYDVRGHGKTESLDDSFSMDLFADDLYELLSVLNIDRACVLGYSMGGRIAVTFALKHPDMATGLIFANSGIPSPDLELSSQDLAEMEEKRGQMINLLETADIEVISDVMAEFSLSPGFRDREPDIFQKYKDVKLKNDPRYYVPIMQVMAGSLENPPDLTQLKCPALIIAGEQDGFMTLDVAESMAAAIPNVEVKAFPTGHASAIEMPEAFNKAVLGFLDHERPKD